MVTAACSLYALLVVSIAGTTLGIATLVLAIVFKFIGFTDSAIIQSSCADSYLVAKYTHLTYQIETSLVGICVGLLMNIIALIILALTIKNLKDLQNQQNPERNQEILSEQVLSKTKYALVYVLLAFGTLGNIVCFGTYLTFLIQAKRDTSTCLFLYNETQLLILVIVSGIWLLTFLIIQVLILKVKLHYEEDQTKEQTKNKYIEMINLTQQVDDNKNNLPKINEQEQFKYSSFVSQIKDRKVEESKVVNNRRRYRDFKPSNNLIHESENNLNQRQTFLSPGAKNQYIVNVQGQRQPANRVLPTENQHRSHEASLINPNTQQKSSLQDYKQRQIRQVNTRPDELKQKIPGIKDPNERLYFHSNGSSRGQNIGALSNKVYSPQKGGMIYNQKIRDIANPNNKTASRARIFDQSIKESRYDGDKNDPYMKNQSSPQNKQRAFNSGIGKPSYRQQEQEQNTKGQLIFYKKAIEQNRKNQYPLQKEKYSSGEVSFKSPSRFDSKFAQEEQNYYNRNANMSILPKSMGISQVSPNSKRRLIQEEYNSVYKNSNIGRSRNHQQISSQGQSRTKARQGVLTSYIRGKFN